MIAFSFMAQVWRCQGAEQVIIFCPTLEWWQPGGWSVIGNLLWSVTGLLHTACWARLFWSSQAADDECNSNDTANDEPRPSHPRLFIRSEPSPDKSTQAALAIRCDPQKTSTNRKHQPKGDKRKEHLAYPVQPTRPLPLRGAFVSLERFPFVVVWIH